MKAATLLRVAMVANKAMGAGTAVREAAIGVTTTMHTNPLLVMWPSPFDSLSCSYWVVRN